MCKNYFCTCDLLLPKVKAAPLRTIYRMLSGDISAAESTNEAKVNARIRLALTLGDPSIIINLCEHNEGKSDKYKIFWDIAANFLVGKASDLVTAVDECRYDQIVHLATAISIKDLLRQIELMCLPNTPIPGKQWLRLQFWPKNPIYKNSLQYTGRLLLKFMVQAQQLHANHTDVHYASALFRYEKEFAIKFHDVSMLVFLDNKHQCKIGEPGYPVAAVDRGNQVIVGKDTKFVVSDHDFTKTGIIPSITMLYDIPETIDVIFT